MAERPTPIEDRLRAAGLPAPARLTWLEVDLSALADNARVLRSMLPPTSRLAIVVKADGYGHGTLAAAHAALAGGAQMLAVATLDEALELRSSGFGARVIILYPVPRGGLDDALRAGLDLAIADEQSLSDLLTVADHSPRVHLAIDSGMTRGGFAPREAASVARRLRAAGMPALAGTWSHLASPEDPAATGAQVTQFEAALAALGAADTVPGVRHLAASGGLLVDGVPAYDMARVGLAFYGHVPREVKVSAARAAAARQLRPALTLKTRALAVETVPAGTRVGYGGTWTADRESRIATLGMGYADGWKRLYAGARAKVRGVEVPLVGRVSSDAVTADVTDVPGFDAGDEVTLLSPNGDGSSVEQLSDMRGSIPWEVLDDLTPRVARVYLEDGRPVAVRYLDGRLVLRADYRLATSSREAGP